MEQPIVIDSTIDVSREMRAFGEILRRDQLKITDQRLQVAETIFRTHQHFTAEAMTDFLKKQDASVSKATVYRILGILVEAKVIIEHDFGQNHKVYEHTIGHEHHDHLFCTKCGKIVEFVNNEIEELQEREAAKNGFKVTRHAMILYGICADCQSLAT